MSSGCGCKEVIDFLIIITYPYSSCTLLFVHLKNVFRSLHTWVGRHIL